MNSLMDRYTATALRISLVQRCACLFGVISLVFAIAAPIAYGSHGVAGILTVLLAAAVSLAGALIGVVLASVHRGTPSAVAWILAGDGIAMALPLVTGTVVSRRGGAIAEAGAFSWIVLFFLAALVTKTLLVAPLAQQAKRAAGELAATTTKVGA